VQFELAKVSLTGHRTENQDRAEIIAAGPSVLLIVVDGMGGHAEGARASETTIACISRRFGQTGQPILDPQGFLTGALTAAHAELVAIGSAIAVEQRPRATCAVCLIQDENIYTGHIGDSRIYQLRGRKVLDRSRDHSHVELLLHEGVISEAELNDHPMRNYVECCLGGDERLPDMSIAGRRRLRPGDVVLLCSDGFWTGVNEDSLNTITEAGGSFESALLDLANQAVRANEPNSDNTTVAALLYPDPDR
jgi:serine/threonine protein phosphatase PrpC